MTHQHLNDTISPSNLQADVVDAADYVVVDVDAAVGGAVYSILLLPLLLRVEDSFSCWDLHYLFVLYQQMMFLHLLHYDWILFRRYYYHY